MFRQGLGRSNSIWLKTSILSWSTTNADSCFIDPGIGDVDISGSVEVSPGETTTYTLTATGPGGVISTSVAVTVLIAPVTLQITSPKDGDLLKGSRVLVQGTVVNRAGINTGVTVNGVCAIVHGGQFVANEVSLEDGFNTITAFAKDEAGNSTTASIGLSADTEADCVRIRSIAYSGIPPLETTLIVRGTREEPSITHTGPGAVEYLPRTNEEEYPIRITTEGIYQFTAEAPNAQGEMCSNTLAIVLLNKNDLDGLLQAKWNGMKAKLSGGAIEEALACFREGSREDYRQIFTALADKLPDIVSNMRDIEMITAENGRVQYRINRIHVVDGEPVTITYYIYFILDEDGLWKLDRF